jgi:adenylate kinase family enzyme
MRKVIVIGSGGAGKTTFAGRLGERLGLEVIHLDRLYWHPGWVKTPKDVWRLRVEELLRRDAWVMDGNYSGTLDLRLEACDTVVFLDMGRAVCLWRVLKRLAQHWHRSRPDMAEGCHERFDLKFIYWILWDYPRRSRPKVLARLAECSRSKSVVRLRSEADVERFLADACDASKATAHAPA